MAQQFSGMLEQFGLSTVSEEELLASRTKARLEQNGALSKEFASTGPRKEQDFRRLGHLMGGALGIKFNPSKLSPQEALQHQAVADAQTSYEEAVKNKPQIAENPIQSELTYQRKLAEALIKTGQYDKAVPIFAQVEQKQRAYKKQQLELKKLNLDNKRSTQVQEIDDYKMTTSKLGEFTTVYPKNSWNENSGVELFVDPMTGNAVKFDENGDKIVQMEAGTFTTARPQVDPISSSTGANGKRPTLQQRGMKSGEPAEMRENILAVQEQMEGAVQIYEIFREAAARGEGMHMLGAEGTLTTAYVRTIDTLQGIANQIGGAVTLTSGTSEGKDLGKHSEAMKYYKENRKSLERELAQWVPQNVRDNSEDAERYYSAMIRLTNARMRAVEPGARQMSDEDFRRAMRETAGATSNPNAFRQIMLNNVLADARKVKSRFDLLPDTIEMSEIIDPKYYDNLVGRLDDFESIFSIDFGTSINPGPGITGIPGADQSPAPGDHSDIDNYFGIPRVETNK